MAGSSRQMPIAGDLGDRMIARDPADPLLRELREQTLWLRLLVIRSMRSEFAAALPTELHRQVYDLSNGIRTTRDIAASAGVGAATVSRWWTQWVRQGLMMPSEAHSGRWSHLASVEELGLGVIGERQEADRG
jgi:hypothetical protein